MQVRDFTIEALFYLAISLTFAIMGRKLFPHILLLFSMLVALAHAVVPHHEHGEVVCFESKHCLSDQYSPPEEQASEMAAIPHSHHPQTCCNSSASMDSNFRKQVQIKAAKDDSSRHFTAILWGYFASACLLNSFEEKKISHFSCYSNLYTSIPAHADHGLRAPPFFN
ncbi:MAG: hypothetical protein BGN96_07515 [Bacteroidales bacterium 45-6]|nr:MAG: hypothetical protein BGN96_07515 [Bacteroidales bacterium 45-6]